jgi:hypothetical protein
MDTKRIDPEQFHERANLAWQELQQTHADIVVIADDNALRLLFARLKADSIPFVYLGINGNPRDYGLSISQHYSGVLERPLIRPTINSFKGPLSLNRVLLLFEQSPTAHAVQRYMLGGQTTLNLSDVEVDYVSTSQFAEWQNHVKSAHIHGYDAIVLGQYQAIKDNSGAYVSGNEVIEWTSNNAAVPLLALYDYAVGHNKAMGGYVISSEAQGRAAAQLIISQLNGKGAFSAPMKVNNSQLIISTSQINKLGITQVQASALNAMLVP